MHLERFEQQAERYAVLDEPQRRAIYLFVRGAHRPLTRDEVARGCDVSRSLAAFHLERLLDAGLLVADYARPPGRGGPGAGRPAKRYVASSTEIALHIPARRYELAGRLLARAIAEAGPSESPHDNAMRVATEEGRRLGAEYARTGTRHDTARAIEVLADVGFEPLVDDAERVVLANCPFHALAETATDLVCGMNEGFVRGIVDGLGIDGLDAVLAPEEGRCCVVLEDHR
jgi:predicted ArsR family transcriptional regulator